LTTKNESSALAAELAVQCHDTVEKIAVMLCANKATVWRER